MHIFVIIVQYSIAFIQRVHIKLEWIQLFRRGSLDVKKELSWPDMVLSVSVPLNRFKDGVEVHDSDRITTEVSMNGVSQLSISNATVRDIGLYSCEAHNMAGRAQTMVRVSVRGKYTLSHTWTLLFNAPWFEFFLYTPIVWAILQLF